MKVIEQLCIKSCSIKIENGDSFTATQGKFYTTSEPLSISDDVQIFSNFWVFLPKCNFIPKEG